MSEKISRRVFLKATGLAALSVAAAGALGGCTGLSPLPGNVTLTPPDDSSFHTVTATNKYDVAATSLSDQWESMSIYESNSKVHHYIYAGVFIKNADTELKITKNNFACKIGGKIVTVAGLGNIGLNSEATYYSIPDSVTIPAGTQKGFPVYLDLKDDSITSMQDQEVVITMNVGKKVTITYVTPSDNNPHVEV